MVKEVRFQHELFIFFGEHFAQIKNTSFTEFKKSLNTLDSLSNDNAVLKKTEKIERQRS